MIPSPEHAQLLEHLTTLEALMTCGFRQEQIVSCRRGVAMLRGTLPDGRHVGVKLVVPGAPQSSPYAPLEMLGRETKWLCKFGKELAAGHYITDGVKTGENWLMVDWLDGAPLDAKMYDLTDPTDIALTFAKAAAAVSALHAAGQVHGDLQPAHFLVSEDTVHLIDFSLAHVPGDFNYRGAMVHFMAPELAAALNGKQTLIMDFAAEIYAFGAVLFFAVTGRVPTGYSDPKAPVADKLAAIATQGCTRPHLLRERLDPDLAEIILGCLALSRAQRFQSLDEVLTALTATQRTLAAGAV